MSGQIEGDRDPPGPLGPDLQNRWGIYRGNSPAIFGVSDLWKGATGARGCRDRDEVHPWVSGQIEGDRDPPGPLGPDLQNRWGIYRGNSPAIFGVSDLWKGATGARGCRDRDEVHPWVSGQIEGDRDPPGPLGPDLQNRWGISPINSPAIFGARVSQGVRCPYTHGFTSSQSRQSRGAGRRIQSTVEQLQLPGGNFPDKTPSEF